MPSVPAADAASPRVEAALTARSVVASTLLGTDPPRLPVGFLIRTGSLFGLADGTVRTALSRMVTSGEAVTIGDGWYELSGAMVERQGRQIAARSGLVVDWSGRWRMAVVNAGARSAADRADLRAAMVRIRMAEMRDGVWLRPDNLDRSDPAWRSEVVDSQCQWFVADAELGLDRDASDLAASLWDLDGWATTATDLRRRMQELVRRLEGGDIAALAPGFVLSAAVLRHFVADPLLPLELQPRRWPGAALRGDYDRYDRTYRDLLAQWCAQA